MQRCPRKSCDPTGTFLSDLVSFPSSCWVGLWLNISLSLSLSLSAFFYRSCRLYWNSVNMNFLPSSSLWTLPLVVSLSLTMLMEWFKLMFVTQIKAKMVSLLLMVSVLKFSSVQTIILLLGWWTQPLFWHELPLHDLQGGSLMGLDSRWQLWGIRKWKGQEETIHSCALYEQAVCIVLWFLNWNTHPHTTPHPHTHTHIRNSKRTAWNKYLTAWVSSASDWDEIGDCVNVPITIQAIE